MAVSPPLIGSLEPMDTINYLEDIPTDTLIGVPRGDMDIEGLKNRLQEIHKGRHLHKEVPAPDLK